MKMTIAKCLLLIAAILPVLAMAADGPPAKASPDLIKFSLGKAFHELPWSEGQYGGIFPTRVQFSHGGRTVHGLLWGKGHYAVILSHGAIYDAASWNALASEIARKGMTALALEEVGVEDILAAHAYLQKKFAVKATALIGASAGGATALAAMTRSPQDWDQLILLSSRGDVSGLGPAPKLFVVSEGEPMAKKVQQMAAEAPGANNELLLIKGSAHAQAIFRTSEGPHLTGVILGRLLKRARPAKA